MVTLAYFLGLFRDQPFGCLTSLLKISVQNMTKVKLGSKKLQLNLLKFLKYFQLLVNFYKETSSGYKLLHWFTPTAFANFCLTLFQPQWLPHSKHNSLLLFILTPMPSSGQLFSLQKRNGGTDFFVFLLSAKQRPLKIKT